jgi:hypothetical protein
MIFPNFLENNAPAKGGHRSTNAERQARYREKRRLVAENNVTSNVTDNATSNVTGNGKDNVTVTLQLQQSNVREELEKNINTKTLSASSDADGVCAPVAKTRLLSGKQAQRFDRFWRLYPRKRGKGDAERACKRR